MPTKKTIAQLAVIFLFIIFALSSASSSQTTSSRGSSYRASSSTFNDIMEGIQAFATGYQIGSRTAALEASPGIYIGNASSLSDAKELTQRKGYNYYIWDMDTKRTYAFRSESSFLETYNSLN